MEEIPCPNCTRWHHVTPAQPVVCCGLRLMVRPDGTAWLQHQRDWHEERQREASA